MNNKIILHFFIALLLFPVLISSGELLKFVLAPYVFYLVWKKDPHYLPALLVFITTGTTLCFVILFTTLLQTVININYFRKKNLQWLLLLSLLPLPVFFYQTFVRIFELNSGLVDTIMPFGFYLGIFPFFYGILIAPKFNDVIWKSLLIALFILPLLRFIPFIEQSIRIYWFSFPLFFAIGMLYLLRLRGFKFHTWEKLLGLLFLISIISGIKFTLLFSGILTFLILYLYQKDIEIVVNWLTKPRLIIVSVSFVVVIIAGIDSYTGFALNDVYMEDASIFNWDNFWSRLEFKAFGDRGVIWAGGWNLVNQPDMIFPPLDPPLNSYYTLSNRLITDVSFGIHNIGLELMRNYGLVMGGLITLIYLLMIIKGAGRIFMNKSINNKYILLFSAAVIGTGIVGGMVGQFVLMINFSLLLMSLAGVFYHITWQTKKNKK